MSTQAAIGAAPAALATSVTELLAETERLTAVLEQENAALAAGDADAIRRVLADKRQACAACESVVRGLVLAGPTDASIRHRLQMAIEKLNRVSAENERRLTAAISARKRLLDIIAGVAQSMRPHAGTYGQSGAVTHRRGPSLAPHAVSFSRAL